MALQVLPPQAVRWPSSVPAVLWLHRGGVVMLVGLPLPERPRNQDEAADRGWDSESVRHDRVTPEPLTAEWQEALDASVLERRKLRGEDR